MTSWHGSAFCIHYRTVLYEENPPVAKSKLRISGPLRWECIGHRWILLQWRHNEPDYVSNHQPHDCLLNRLFGRRSKETSQLSVTGLREGNSPVTGELPVQRASNAENTSIWWRNDVITTRSVMWSFDGWSVVGLNKMLNKQSICQFRHTMMRIWRR